MSAWPSSWPRMNVLPQIVRSSALNRSAGMALGLAPSRRTWPRSRSESHGSWPARRRRNRSSGHLPSSAVGTSAPGGKNRRPGSRADSGSATTWLVQSTSRWKAPDSRMTARLAGLRPGSLLLRRRSVSAAPGYRPPWAAAAGRRAVRRCSGLGLERRRPRPAARPGARGISAPGAMPAAQYVVKSFGPFPCPRVAASLAAQVPGPV